MNRIVDDIYKERKRQEELALAGRFKFTAANPGLTHIERLPMLTEEIGEVAKQVLQQPDSGLMPVTHADRFDGFAAGDDSPEAGTRQGLRKELVQVAAIAFAWIEALDSAHGSSAHEPRESPATDTAWKPQSAPTETHSA